MASGHRLREHLVEEIERLPDDRLPEVLDFVSYVLRQQRNTIDAQERTRPGSRPDSLEAFIGGLEAEPISGDIDEIVYGV